MNAYGIGDRGSAHLEPDTSGDQAACTGQPRVRRSIKLMRKMSILQPLMQITDYA